MKMSIIFHKIIINLKILLKKFVLIIFHLRYFKVLLNHKIDKIILNNIYVTRYKNLLQQFLEFHNKHLI
jgi:hypothetical protein